MLSCVLCGCSASVRRTNFLSTYDNLGRVQGSHAFVADRSALDAVTAVYVEPVSLRLDSKTNVTQEQARQIADELRAALTEAVAEHRTLARTPTPDVARLRVALTRIRKGAWLVNLHPGAKLTGSGLGGAAIEAELLDASGHQLWALVEMRKGDQMELDTFDELDDPRDAITHWGKVVRSLFAGHDPQP
ncbi:MAG: DUF3313 domain-containing protein [Phycisphaerales bacterium]